MKRAATDHPKLANLADAIAGHYKHQRRFAILVATGVLERLWHFTAKFAPQGDIGRRRDDEICRWIGWPIEESSTLISLLIQSEWLMNHPVHRLIVHDWAEHADESVKKMLQRKGLPFVCPDMSRHVPPSLLPEASSQKPEPVIHTSASGDAVSVCDQSPPPKPPRPKPEPDPRDSWFDEFWCVYGKLRCSGKKAAHKAFLRAIATEEKFRYVMARLELQRPSLAGRDPQFRPHAATWLNGERWEDAPDRQSATVDLPFFDGLPDCSSGPPHPGMLMTE